MCVLRHVVSCHVDRPGSQVGSEARELVHRSESSKANSVNAEAKSRPNARKKTQRKKRMSGFPSNAADPARQPDP